MNASRFLLAFILTSSFLSSSSYLQAEQETQEFSEQGVQVLFECYQMICQQAQSIKFELYRNEFCQALNNCLDVNTYKTIDQTKKDELTNALIAAGQKLIDHLEALDQKTKSFEQLNGAKNASQILLFAEIFLALHSLVEQGIITQENGAEFQEAFNDVRTVLEKLFA